MSWLDNIPSVKDLIDPVSGTMPRRNIVKVVGAQASDDTVNRETVLTVTPEGRWDSRVNLVAGGNIANVDKEVYRFSAASALTLYGLEPPTQSGRHIVMVVSDVTGGTVLEHASSSATADAWRFDNPGGVDVTISDVGFLYYDRTSSRWRPLMIG